MSLGLAKKSNSSIGSILLTIFLFIATPAMADPTRWTVPLNRGTATLIQTPTTGDIINTVTALDRSYCCTIGLGSDVDYGAYFSEVRNVFGAPVAWSISGLMEPKIPYVWGHSNPGRARACFMTTQSTDTSGFDLIMAFDAPPPGGANIPVQCDETTLFGGFNTSVTDFNFLEITNTTDSDQIVEIIAINSVSGNSRVIDGLVSTVRANTRSDIDIHSRVGTGAFGPMIIKSYGPAGSLRAVLSQYNITSSVPLDFAPVSFIEFKTRHALTGGN